MSRQRAIQIPGIARDTPNRIEGMASGEFWYVRFGQRNCPIGSQRGYGAVVCWCVVFGENWRAVGGQLPSDIIVVLHGHRQAREPARVVATLIFKALCTVARFLEKSDRQGIDLWLYGLNARGCGFHQF
jgi:hypothetical protein